MVVLDHFHAMGTSPGYGANTTAELAARAMAIKALAGRRELDVLIVAQLNRGAYGSTSGPDVSLHHGKFRHGQLDDADLSKSLLRIDRAHCFLEADEARLAYGGGHLYPGVSVR